MCLFEVCHLAISGFYFWRTNMKISDNIIKEQLKNVYFLCGGAYGGKTTMAKLLEEKYGFYRYRQGDHYGEYEAIAKPEYQSALCSGNECLSRFPSGV